MNREDEFFNKNYLQTNFNNAMKINSATGVVYDFAGPGAAAQEPTTYDDLKHPITEVQTKAYAAAVEITPIYKETIVNQAVEGALAFTADTTYAKLGDKMYAKFINDGTQRTVIMGAGFAPVATVVGTVNKSILVSFYFDGTNFQEFARTAAF